MKIEVTSRDISEGKRDNAESCPIALACLMAGLTSPRVKSTEVLVIGFGFDLPGVNIPLPIEAQRFIARFDAGLKVEAFTFELPVEIGEGGAA